MSEEDYWDSEPKKEVYEADECDLDVCEWSIRNMDYLRQYLYDY